MKLDTMKSILLCPLHLIRSTKLDNFTTRPTIQFINSLNKSYNGLIIIHQASAQEEKTEFKVDSPREKGIKIGGNPYAIAVNPDNNVIYAIDKYYKKISFIDGDTDTIVKTVTISNSRSPNLFKYNISDISSAIAVDPISNLIYVTNSGSDTISVLDGSEGNIVTNFTVDGSPRAIAASSNGSDIKVVTQNNQLNNKTFELASRIYDISGFYNRIEKERTATIPNDFLMVIDIDPDSGIAYVTGAQGAGIDNLVYTVNNTECMCTSNVTKLVLSEGQNYNLGIALNLINGKVYVTHNLNGTVFIFNKNSKNPIKSNVIKVGGGPVGVAVNPRTNIVYVANAELDIVHAINGNTGESIKNITVGDQPRYIAVNHKSNMIYVTNFNSGTISVINGTTNNVTADVRFSINPSIAGTITCNNHKITQNFTRYDIGSSIKCQAQSNNGYQFSSWSSDFDLTTAPGISNIFDFISYEVAGNKNYKSTHISNENNNNNIPLANFTVSKYGKLSANFITSTSIPSEFWTPFYALIPAFIGSTFIPSIHNAIKQKRTQDRNLKEYIDKIGKMDKSKIEEEITNLHTKGEISKSGYSRLKDEISKHYKDKGTAMPHGVQ